VLGEGRTHNCSRPVAVVGGCLDQDGHTRRTVALVGDFLEVLAIGPSGGLLDDPLDVVGGHVDRSSPRDGYLQHEVGVRLGTTLPGSHVDFTGDLGEQGAPLGVDLAFAQADVVPLRMT